EERHVHDVHRVGVLRVGENPRVVPRALTELALLIGAGPRRAPVVGAEHAAGIRFDDRVYALRVRGRHGDADVTDDARRQTGITCELGPVLAAVGGLEDAAARAAAHEQPRLAAGLPHRGVERVRIVGIHRQVAHAGGVVAEQYLAPRFPAVGGLEHTAFRVRRPDVA